MRNIFNRSAGVLLALCLLGHAGRAQEIPWDIIPVNDAEHPCISNEAYALMETRMAENAQRLSLTASTNKTSATSLQWPLKTAPGFNPCGYYYISAFVDQNTGTGQIQDWNCGTRTYDGHRGIDIVPWPFSWNNMDNNHVQVIAAAAGTIVDKADGNPDRYCSYNGGAPSNYISIQHADGSRAIYAHFKTGSLTAKGIGATVTAGEFLGITGSSGQSTGVHLHFEVRSDGTFANYIDPNAGACNPKITSSWWASQKPYAEPEILRLSIHSQWPYFAVCPNTTDTLYEKNSFISSPGATAIFYSGTRHVTSGMAWNFKILNPDRSTFSSWNYTSASTRNSMTVGFTKTLPTIPGTYTYQGTFNGITCEKTFIIQSIPTGLDLQQSQGISLYPNPARNWLTISRPTIGSHNGNYEFSICNTLGETVLRQTIASNSMEMHFDLPSGIYMYRLSHESEILATGKLVVLK